MKVKNERWWLSPKINHKFFFYLLIVFLPTQFGKHFWPSFSIVQGLRLDYLSPTFYFTDVLCLALLFSWFWQSKTKLLDLKVAKAKIYWIGIFIISVIAGVWLSKSPQAGWYGLVKLLELFCFACYVSSTVNLSDITSNLPKLFALSMIFESLLAIWEFYQQRSVNGIFYFLGERSFTGQTPGIANASLSGNLILRPYATFSHPNVLAGYLLLGLIFIIQTRKTFSLTKKTNYLFLVAILLGVLSIILSLSRTAIFILIIFLLFKFSYLFLIKKRRRVSRGLYALLLLLSGLFLLFTPLLSQRFNFSFSEESIAIRQQLMSVSLQMIKDHFLFGVGLNNFFIQLPHYYHPLSLVFFIQPVHNIYLLWLSQVGFIAFLLSLLFIIKTIIYQSQKVNTRIILLPLLIASLMLGLTDHYLLTLQQGQLLMALILGLNWTKNISS